MLPKILQFISSGITFRILGPRLFSASLLVSVAGAGAGERYIISNTYAFRLMQSQKQEFDTHTHTHTLRMNSRTKITQDLHHAIMGSHAQHWGPLKAKFSLACIDKTRVTQINKRDSTSKLEWLIIMDIINYDEEILPNPGIIAD